MFYVLLMWSSREDCKHLKFILSKITDLKKVELHPMQIIKKAKIHMNNYVCRFAGFRVVFNTCTTYLCALQA